MGEEIKGMWENEAKTCKSNKKYICTATVPVVCLWLHGVQGLHLHYFFDVRRESTIGLYMRCILVINSIVLVYQSIFCTVE